MSELDSLMNKKQESLNTLGLEWQFEHPHHDKNKLSETFVELIEFTFGLRGEIKENERRISELEKMLRETKGQAMESRDDGKCTPAAMERDNLVSLLLGKIQFLPIAKLRAIFVVVLEFLERQDEEKSSDTPLDKNLVDVMLRINEVTKLVHEKNGEVYGVLNRLSVDLANSNVARQMDVVKLERRVEILESMFARTEPVNPKPLHERFGPHNFFNDGRPGPEVYAYDEEEHKRTCREIDRELDEEMEEDRLFNEKRLTKDGNKEP